MLTKLTLGEKLKDLRLAKGYKSTEHLASIEDNDRLACCIWLVLKNKLCKRV